MTTVSVQGFAVVTLFSLVKPSVPAEKLTIVRVIGSAVYSGRLIPILHCTRCAAAVSVARSTIVALLQVRAERVKSSIPTALVAIIRRRLRRPRASVGVFYCALDEATVTVIRSPVVIELVVIQYGVSIGCGNLARRPNKHRSTVARGTSRRSLNAISAYEVAISTNAAKIKLP